MRKCNYCGKNTKNLHRYRYKDINSGLEDNFYFCVSCHKKLKKQAERKEVTIFELI